MAKDYLSKISTWARKYAIWLLIISLTSLAANVQLVRLANQSLIQADESQQTLLYNAAEMMSRTQRRIDKVIVLEEGSLSELDEMVYNLMFTYQMKMHLACRDVPAAERDFFYRMGGAVRSAVQQAVQHEDEKSLHQISEACMIASSHIHQMAQQLSKSSGPLAVRPPGTTELYRDIADDLREQLQLAGSWELLSTHINGEQ